MPRARVRRNKQSDWRFEPSICRPTPPIACSVASEATESYARSQQSTWYEAMTGRSINDDVADRAYRIRDNGPRWVPRDCRCPPSEEDFVPELTTEDTNINKRSMHQSNWYNDMTVQPTYTSEPVVVTDRTHDHLFGDSPPAPPVVRRPDPSHVCTGPRWSSPSPQPPAVDDFTRTRRNVHGHELPSPRPVVTPIRCTTPCTIIAPDPLPPVCCPPGSSSVVSEEYERTKRNVFGPNDPAPLRLPARTDDFVNSNLNVFGPATTLPLRRPQRTSDFDDSRRNLFGSHLPYVPSRPSLRPPENTYDDLFGKCQPRRPMSPRVATPPARKQNINVLTTVVQSPTPARLPPRPQADTFTHVFGGVSPATISEYCRFSKDESNKLEYALCSRHANEQKMQIKQPVSEQHQDTFDRIFGNYEPPPCITYYDWEKEDDDEEDTFQTVFGRTKQTEIHVPHICH